MYEVEQMDVLIPVMSTYGLLYFGMFVVSVKGDWWCRGGVRKVTRRLRRNYVLFKKSDIYLAEMFVTVQNNPSSILKMILPPAMFLAFCPAIMFVAPLLFEQLWPDKFPERPDINEGIGCFLGLAGLICAINYGYAFEGALKQRFHTKRILRERMDAMETLLHALDKATFIDNRGRLGVVEILKREAIVFMKIIVQWTRKQERSHADEFTQMLKGYLLDNNLSAGDGCALKKVHMADMQAKAETITECCAEKVIASMKPKLTGVNWVILIILGYISCVGVMFVKLGSHKVDLLFFLMSVITLFIFLYVLADLDNPMHGISGVNLKEHFEFLREIDLAFQKCLALHANTILLGRLADFESSI